MSPLSLQVSIEIFVWPNGFEINQSNAVVESIPKQIQLACTMKFVDVQCCQIAPFTIPDFGTLRYFLNSSIHISSSVVVKLFVLSGKSARLTNRPDHWCALRGTNGIDCSRGSDSEASDSAIKLTGKSGLSSAALPTRAQNSI